MGRSFMPGFRAPAFGIQTQNQMVLFSALVALFIAALTIFLGHFFGSRIAVISPILISGGLEIYTWARLRTMGLSNDIGDLITGIILFALAVAIVLIHIRRIRKQALSNPEEHGV